MAKITDYPKTTTLTSSNVFLLDGPNGTKGILTKDLANALLGSLNGKEIMSHVVLDTLVPTDTLQNNDLVLIGQAGGNRAISLPNAFYAMMDTIPGAEVRKNVWRGRNLGSVVTDEQYAQIAAGTFKGLFVGDFWTMGGRTWRIVDMDYWYGTGDVNCSAHHVVIMPDRSLYYTKMNDTGTTEGGYVGSKMYTTNLTQAKGIINGAFSSDHVLSHREFLTNAVTDGHASGGSWYDSILEIPSETMIYGHTILSPRGNGQIVISNYTVDKTQLSAMGIMGRLMNLHRENYWLRDIITAYSFAYMSLYGNSANDSASKDYGVRPVFGIKA